MRILQNLWEKVKIVDKSAIYSVKNTKKHQIMIDLHKI